MMPAAIDTSANTQGSAVYYKRPAWHNLGIVIDTKITAREAITKGKLDIPLRKIPLFAVGDKEENGKIVKWPYAVPALYGVQRTDTGLVLSVVGENYTIVPNDEAFEFMDVVLADYLEEGEELTYESAGLLDEGRRIWLLAHIPTTVEVAGEDVVTLYGLLSNSHDGTTSLKVSFTTVRVVCQNTLTMALRGFKGKVRRGQAYSVRHTANIKEQMKEAKHVMNYLNREKDLFAKQAKELVSRQVTKAAFKDFAKAVVATVYNPQKDDDQDNTDGASLLDSIIDIQTANTQLVSEMVEKTASDRRKANAQSMLDAILTNYDNPRQTMPGVAGTAWAAYNSVTEYVDHGPKNYRGDERQKAETRMKSITEGQGASLKATALELIYQTMMG